MKQYLRLLEHLKPYKFRLFVAAICTALASAGTVVLPWIIKDLVDQVLSEKDAEKEADELAKKYQMPKDEFLKQFGGIDMVQYDLEVRKTIELLKELNKELGLTIIMISHQINVIESICNRVAILSNSKLVEEGELSDVFLNPKTDIAKNKYPIKQPRSIISFSFLNMYCTSSNFKEGTKSAFNDWYKSFSICFSSLFSLV